MDKYGPETFGKLNAADYDRLHNPGTTDEAVALLAELFAGQRVLELAIGSGRIALPLALQGIDIHGIDASTEMVAKLRGKHRGVRWVAPYSGGGHYQRLRRAVKTSDRRFASKGCGRSCTRRRAG